MISLEKNKDKSDENSVHFRMYEIYPYLKLKKKERKARSFWIKIKFLKFRDTMSLRTRFWIIELISSCDKDKIETLLR